MSNQAAGRRRWVGLVVAALVAVLLWWVQSGDDGSTYADDPSDGSSAFLEPLPKGEQPPRATTDEVSGLPIVHLDQLPPEATHTLALIRAGGPYPYDEDGGTFGNYEGLLPDEDGGYYREFTVDTPGSDDRGARRIIQGGHGEVYWTDDHYASFSRIQR